MELLNSANVTIPFYQIALLLVISTLVLLFGRVKLALLATYVFISYWGFLANEGVMAGSVLNMMGFFCIGLPIIIFALIGFFTAIE
jgi:hypothetical protein